MNVTGISGNSTNTVFQWNNQQLQSQASGTSTGSTHSSKLRRSLPGYGNMSSQLSSMVALTKYAMDAMGLESDSRVTFTQITKYRDQLNTEFNTAVKEGIANLGVHDPTVLSFTLNTEGKLIASGNDTNDVTNTNAWLTANGQLGKDLRSMLTAAGLPDKKEVTMNLDTTGKFIATNDNSMDAKTVISIQDALDGTILGKSIYDGLTRLAVDADAAFTLKVDDITGDVTVESSDSSVKSAMQLFFDNNPELVKKFRQIEALSSLDDARKAIQISPSDIRKRIEIESLASWWSDTGNGNTSFGNYNNSNLSILSGLNLNV